LSGFGGVNIIFLPLRGFLDASASEVLAPNAATNDSSSFGRSTDAAATSAAGWAAATAAAAIASVARGQRNLFFEKRRFYFGQNKTFLPDKSICCPNFERIPDIH